MFDVFLSGMLFRGDGGGGVAALRRDLATHARGHVLEVAVGTGRNLPSLDWKGMALAIKEDEEDRNVQARKSETKDSGPARSWFGWFGKGAPSQANDDSGLDGRMRSYTGIDLSLAVLELARDRLRAAVRKVPEMKSLPPELLGEAAILEAGGEPARQRSAGGWNGLLRLVHGDVLQGVPPPPPASWHQARAAGPADKDAGLPSKGSEASPSASATPLPKYYDTILSTFSLCSLDSPTVLLAHLARSLAPGTGRIHLVEHGRAPSPFPSWWPTLSSHSSSSASSVSNSSSSASPVSNSSSPAPPVSGSSSWWSRWTSSPGDGVNARLDAGAAHHYARFGCWWNRDIEALVRAAVEEINTSHGSSSDIGGRLEIVTVRRPQPIRQLGTIVWIELRVVPRGEATSTAAKKTSEATG